MPSHVLPVVPSINVGTPLTHAQMRVWLVQQLRPESTELNVSTAFELEGNLDVAALASALRAIGARHEMLRTGIHAKDGIVVQRVDDTIEVELEVCEVRDERERDERILAEARYRFDLARPPLIRTCLLRSRADLHILVITVHHIVFDDWSAQLLWKELSAFYAAQVIGRDVRLRPLGVQYRDYAAESAGKEALGGITDRSANGDGGEWPTYPRELLGRGGVGRGAYHVRFSAETSALVRAVAVREHLTPFIVCGAATLVHVARFCDEGEVAAAVPVTLRQRPEFDQLIGLFIDVSNVSLSLTSDLRMREVLLRTRAAVLGAIERCGSWAFRTADEMQQLSRIYCDWRSTAPPAKLHDLNVRLVAIPHDVARTDVAYTYGWSSEGCLECSVQYDVSRYSAASPAAWCDQIETILRHCAEPDASAFTLECLTKADRNVLARTNATTVHRGGDRREVHEIVSEVAARVPAAAAVAADGRLYTFAELERRSTLLAEKLRDSGAAAGSAVALVMRPSFARVATTLAVWKAGATCIPIDAGEPHERVAKLLASSRPALVVEDTHGAPVGDTERLIAVHARTESVRRGGYCGAYLLHTSGSTGEPKAVEVEHRSLANVVTCLSERFELRVGDRVSHTSSFSYDIALLEFIAPLMAGATVCVGRDHFVGDSLGKWLADERITVLITSPSRLSTVPLTLPLPDLRAVVIGGEPCPEPLIRGWARDHRVFYGYGPTETAICSSLDEYRPEHWVENDIGTPVHDTQLYVLNRRGQHALTHSVGELFIGGAGVACGYAGRPRDTAEQFRPSPWSDAGTRLYATGDMCRRLVDGRIQFVGRRDSQVKVRGVRIDLGEVEAECRAVLDVTDVVAATRVGERGETRIAAWARVPDGRKLHIERAIGELRKRLPLAAVPDRIVAVREWPMTPGGKVDRSALALQSRETPAVDAIALPRDELQYHVSLAWQTVLDRHDIGVTTDFFLAGGDSFAALSVIAHIARAFRSEFSLAEFVRHPTIEGQARWLAEHRCATPAPSSLVPLQMEGNHTLYCVHSLSGSARRFSLLARYLQGRAKVLAFQAPPLHLQGDAPFSLEAMAATYVRDLREHDPVGPYCLCGYSFGCAVAFEMARQLVAAGCAPKLIALIDGVAPGSLTEAASDSMMLAGFGRDQARLRGRTLDLPPEALVGMSEAEALEHVRLRLLDAGVLEWIVDTDLLKPFLAAARQRLVALQRYTPTSLPANVTLVVAENASAENQRAWEMLGVSLDETLGWSRIVGGRIEVVKVPGFHATLVDEPNVSVVAQELYTRMA